MRASAEDWREEIGQRHRASHAQSVGRSGRGKATRSAESSRANCRATAVVAASSGRKERRQCAHLRPAERGSSGDDDDDDAAAVAAAAAAAAAAASRATRRFSLSTSLMCAIHTSSDCTTHTDEDSRGQTDEHRSLGLMHVAAPRRGSICPARVMHRICLPLQGA